MDRCLTLEGNVSDLRQLRGGEHEAWSVITFGPRMAETTTLMRWLRRRGHRGRSLPLGSCPLETMDMARIAFAVFDAALDAPLAVAECACARIVAANLPLIVLGNEREDINRAALRSGATIFLARPLDAQLLVNHAERFILAASSRSENRRPDTAIERALGFEFDADTHSLRINGKERPLTPETYRLLSYLVSHPGRVITAEELVRAGVLLPTQRSRYRAVVWQLRKHLGEAASLIQLVRGFGYRFAPPHSELRSTAA